MPTHDQHQKAQTLLQQLRASPNPVARQHVAQVERAYRALEMDALSTDIYDDAKGVGQPPLGWVLASEHSPQELPRCSVEG